MGPSAGYSRAASAVWSRSGGRGAGGGGRGCPAPDSLLPLVSCRQQGGALPEWADRSPSGHRGCGRGPDGEGRPRTRTLLPPARPQELQGSLDPCTRRPLRVLTCLPWVWGRPGLAPAAARPFTRCLGRSLERGFWS